MRAAIPINKFSTCFPLFLYVAIEPLTIIVVLRVTYLFCVRERKRNDGRGFHPLRVYVPFLFLCLLYYYSCNNVGGHVPSIVVKVEGSRVKHDVVCLRLLLLA